MRSLESLTGPLVQQSRLDEVLAENVELRRKLAAKGDKDDKTPGQDEDNPSDVDNTDVPNKRGKKKTKPQADDEDDTGDPSKKDPEDDDPQRPNPPSPKQDKDEREKDGQAYRAQVQANIAAIVAANDRRHGVEPSSDITLGNSRLPLLYPREEVKSIFTAGSREPSDDAYWARVNASAAAIVEANKRRHDVVEASVPLPSNPVSLAILEAYDASKGRKLTE